MKENDSTTKGYVAPHVARVAGKRSWGHPASRSVIREFEGRGGCIITAQYWYRDNKLSGHSIQPNVHSGPKRWCAFFFRLDLYQTPITNTTTAADLSPTFNITLFRVTVIHQQRWHARVDAVERRCTYRPTGSCDRRIVATTPVPQTSASALIANSMPEYTRPCESECAPSG